MDEKNNARKVDVDISKVYRGFVEGLKFVRIDML